jgi:hypothetical protein
MLLDIWDPRKLNDHIAMPAASRTVAAQRHRARRFKFTDEVTAALARLLRDFPNALLDNYQFALPPYDTCYLEFDLALFLKEMGLPTTSDLAEYQGSIADETIGYLIHDYQVNTLIQGENKGAPIVGAITYTYVEHRPVPGCFPLKFDGTPETEHGQDDHMLAFLLGSTLTNPRSTLTSERANDLILRVRPHFERTVKKPKMALSLVQGSVGEARNLMALLLWLNQPKVLHVADAPATRGWFQGKPRAYAAHHIVRLRPEVTYRSIVKAFAPRRAPRRHEVEAFWRNFEKTACVHDWPILPDENGHWHCKKCPQWRTRVKQHERGDAGVGFVSKEYRA